MHCRKASYINITMTIKCLLFLISLIILQSCSEAPEQKTQEQRISELTAQEEKPPNQVSKIIDGDSFVLTHSSGEEETINLVWVDAPEREQPHGREAKNFLREQLLNQSVSYTEQNEVMVNGENLNLKLLQQGMAWLAPMEGNFAQHFAYSEAQTDAMNNLRGFWGLDHGLRVPPWVWRQQGKERRMDPQLYKRLASQKQMSEQKQKTEQQRKTEQ